MTKQVALMREYTMTHHSSQNSTMLAIDMVLAVVFQNSHSPR
jgi:hypothetical protein